MFVRLEVTASGRDKADLVAALEERAREFYGEESFRLLDAIEAEPDVEVGNVAGKTLAVRWSGRARFVNTQ